MKRSLSLSVGALGALWIAATGVLLFYVADLAPIQALLLAFVTMDVAFLAALALLITTNTRPPWPADPYGLDTAELLRPPLLRANERRQTHGTVDDRTLTERISDMVEEDAAQRPMAERTPLWINERHDDADDTFGAEES